MKPRGDIAHILSCIEEGARYNQQQKKQMKRQEAELNDPIITVESILLVSFYLIKNEKIY